VKKEYVVEIISAILFVFLIAYMIFTWKNLTPDQELSTETEKVLVDSSEGVDS